MAGESFIEHNPRPAGLKKTNAAGSFARMQRPRVGTSSTTGPAAYQPLAHFLKRHAPHGAEAAPGLRQAHPTWVTIVPRNGVASPGGWLRKSPANARQQPDATDCPSTSRNTRYARPTRIDSPQVFFLPPLPTTLPSPARGRRWNGRLPALSTGSATPQPTAPVRRHATGRSPYRHGHSAHGPNHHNRSRRHSSGHDSSAAIRCRQRCNSSFPGPGSLSTRAFCPYAGVLDD